MWVCSVLVACGKNTEPKAGDVLACHSTPQGCSAEDMKKATGYGYKQ